MAGCIGEGSGIASSRVNARFIKRAETCLRLSGVDVDALDGVYLTISSKDTQFYLWFNYDGASVDPAPAGLTGIEIAVIPTDTTKSVAQKIATDPTIITLFHAQHKGETVQLTLREVGEAFAPSSDIDSGVNVVSHSQGFDVDLGLLEGDVEIATETSTTDITAHQTGDTVIQKLISGITVTSTLTLLEFSGERQKALMGLWGNNYTDSEGNFLQGAGSKSFTKTADDISGSLLIEPIDDDSEKKKVIWKAQLSISSFLHAQSEPFKATLDFTSLIDKTKPEEIDIMAIGDYEELLNGVAN